MIGLTLEQKLDILRERDPSIDLEGQVLSPCLRVCKIDATLHCSGCFRTVDEIRGWDASSAEEKRAVWTQILVRAEDRVGV